MIPCYRYGKYLPAAVQSALDQHGVDVEVVIVDDASPDDSADVARRLADGDPRVRVIVHESNQGHIATYNDGLRAVTGDYVVLLSADDLLAEQAVSRAVALLEADRTVGLVYGSAVEFAGAPPRTRTAIASWTVWDGDVWIRRMCARGTNLIRSPEVVLRRNLMDDLDGYDPRHPHAADMLLWMRAAARANVGRVNGPDQAFYRAHDTSMSKTTFRGWISNTLEQKRVFDQFFSEDFGGHRNGQHLYARASRAMAAEALRLGLLAICAGGTYDGASTSEYGELAVECDEGIRSSHLWKRFASLQQNPPGPIKRVAIGRIVVLRWKLRWRRWQRYGT